MVLTSFIGRSFERSFVYAGIGPSLAQTQTDLKGVIGFASINGVTTNITGAPTSLSSSQWVIGGAATAGMTWFLDKSWFVDLNYSASLIQNRTIGYSGAFANTNSGTTTNGVLSGYYTGSVFTHSVGFSINRAF